MSIARALAVLGSGAGGYMEGEELLRRRRREEEDDAFRREQRDRQRADWKFTDEERARKRAEEEALNKGAAPVTAAPAGVRDDTADDRDVGQPDGPSFGIRVGQQVVPTQAAADASMAQQNTPAGTMARMAALPGVGADTRLRLQQGAQQAELTGLQLQQAKDAEAAKQWTQRWGKALGEAINGKPEAITKFMSDSKADGQEGESKWGHIVKDGKVTIFPVGPDGTAMGQGVTFDDNQAGWLRFGMHFDKNTPISAKLADLRAEQKAADDKADKDAHNARADRELRLKERLTGAQIAELGRRGSGGGGAAPVAQPGLNMADADKFINTLFTTKDEMTGQTVFNPLGAQAVRGLMLRMPAAQQGDTQGAVNQALTVYQQALKVAGGDHAKAMQAIEAASRPPQAPAAPAAPVATPGASMSGAAQRPRGDYGMFEKMDDTELAKYVKAGNIIAIEVAKERAKQQQSQPVDMGGLIPG